MKIIAKLDSDLFSLKTLKLAVYLAKMLISLMIALSETFLIYRTFSEQNKIIDRINKNTKEEVSAIAKLEGFQFEEEFTPRNRSF